MKTPYFLIIIFLMINSLAFSQSPNTFKYQTIVRDASGYTMANQNVSFQISILQSSSSGTTIYTETHTGTTNEFGLINLNIGLGTTTDNFSTINWANGPYFLKIELDETGGNSFTLMGTSQLLSVPYAMYAKDVENKDDADADATNELISSAVLSGTNLEISDAGGTTIIDLSSLDQSGMSVDDADADPTNELQMISKLGNTVTLSNGGGSFTDEVNDGDISSTNELQVINFSNDTLYLDNGGQVYLGSYGNLWQQNDTNIYYNNGWVGVGTSTPSGMMVVQGDSGVDPDSALFEVKNKNGQTIFAVYDGGVRIWVDDSPAKASTNKGGFAVAGYRVNKVTTNEYLRVTPDSVRVYIREDTGVKASTDKGGFAVAGYRVNKSTTSEYFNINPNLNADTLNPSEARIYWYPLKEAFLSGRVLVESVDSVGLNSWASGFESKSIGDYSQALGYKARAFGDNSTAIGNNANVEGNNSYAIGNSASTVGLGSYAIGTGALATGDYSFAVGSEGKDAGNNPTSAPKAVASHSYAFGMGSVSSGEGAFTFGTKDTATGNYSLATGIYTVASGNFATAIGGYGNISSGTSSIAMGHNNIASGDYSLATGFLTMAIGTNSTTMGISTIASGEWGATAMGGHTEAKGNYSTAIGNQIIAKSYAETAIGVYNDTSSSTNQTSWLLTDPIFIIGNGVFNNRHNAMTVLKNGNIGINTVSPSELFDIYGDSPNIEISNNLETDAGIIFNDAQAVTTQYAKILFNSSTRNLTIYNSSTTPIITINPSGYVGIGTTNFNSHRLSVSSAISGTSGSTGFILNSNSSGLAMIIENSSYSSSDNVLLLTQRGSTGDIASFDSYHGSTSGWDREFRFTNTGDGRCDGSWIAGGADYAEFFPKADTLVEYEIGDIITLSPSKTYTVEGAKLENSQLMIGVYSSNPAIVGNSSAEIDPENSVLVGMVGVIKTKVNNENGPIKIGDYITISSTDKVGMKAIKSGMVVGRAMDNYNADGIGLINILVETDWYFSIEEGNITSSEIKNTLTNQQKELEILKAEVEQLKQILEVKAEK